MSVTTAPTKVSNVSGLTRLAIQSPNGAASTPPITRPTTARSSSSLSVSEPASVSVAIGDGANDVPMIAAAGLGIAYRAKPVTEAAADARVRYGDLDVVRYALGLT